MANPSTAIEDKSTVEDAAKSLGKRIDALIATIEKQPLVAVGIGVVAGYLLARILDR